MDVAAELPHCTEGDQGCCIVSRLLGAAARGAAAAHASRRYSPLPWLLSSCQPMSLRSGRVRSRLSVRSALMAGSIRRFGVALGSQCEIVEPSASAAGV